MIKSKFIQAKVWLRRKRPRRNKIKPGCIAKGKKTGNYYEVIKYLGRNSHGDKVYLCLNLLTGEKQKPRKGNLSFISE